MKILAIHATRDTDKPDATGAFIPQAVGFAKYRRAAGDVVESIGFDNSLEPASRRTAVLELIRAHQPFDAFVYFGHGTRRGLPSAAFTMSSVQHLADALASAPSPSRLIVALYACSTANTPTSGIDGDGGFADTLRDALSTRGRFGWLDAHTVAGHTTINRMTRRFYMDGESVATGGTWLIAPGSPEWQAWGDALKSDKSLRFGFPFMTETELHARLPG